MGSHRALASFCPLARVGSGYQVSKNEPRWCRKPPRLRDLAPVRQPFEVLHKLSSASLVQSGEYKRSVVYPTNFSIYPSLPPRLQGSHVSSLQFSSQNGNKKAGAQYDPEYHVAAAQAVQTLLDELPNIFQRELSFDIYTPDLQLRLADHCIQNLANYRFMLRSFRSVVNLFCRYSFLDVWRVRSDEEGAIFLRWRLYLAGRVGGELDFEGVSEYRLNSKGKICVHIIDTLVRNQKGKKDFSETLLDRLFPKPCLQPG